MRQIRIYNFHTIEHKASEPAAMIVCVCRRVSDRDIARFARAGMGFDEIQWELGVATQCGRCEGCARDVVAQCNAVAPVAALRNEATSNCGCMNGNGDGCDCDCDCSVAGIVPPRTQ